MSDFYRRLDERINSERIERIFRARPENIHDYQGCNAAPSTPAPQTLNDHELLYRYPWKATEIRRKLYDAESELARERESRKQAEAALRELHTLRPRSEYHEDYGAVLWYSVPICEAPIVDGYDVDDIDWSYTHWSPIPSNPKVAIPQEPAERERGK